MQRAILWIGVACICLIPSGGKDAFSILPKYEIGVQIKNILYTPGSWNKYLTLEQLPFNAIQLVRNAR
jgi:hypothetical protein